MRTFIAAFLFIVFLFNVAGYFFAFKVVRNQVRKEVKREIEKGVPEQFLTRIVISKQDEELLSWHRVDHEFSYKNQLYDIVRMEKADDTTIYYCLRDSQEEALFADLEHHIDRHLSDKPPANNSSGKKIADNVIKLYYFEENSFPDFSSARTKNQSFFNFAFPASVVLDKTNPPPEKS
jgi:hypothetical protein